MATGWAQVQRVLNTNHYTMGDREIFSLSKYFTNSLRFPEMTFYPDESSIIDDYHVKFHRDKVLQQLQTNPREPLGSLPSQTTVMAQTS